MIKEFCITFIKMFFFNICSSLVFSKIKENRKIKNIILIIANFVLSIIYSIIYMKYQLKEYNTAVINNMCYILYMIFCQVIAKNNLEEGVVLSVISISISYIGMFISTTIVFIILEANSMNIKSEKFWEYALIGMIETILIYLFFKIKRYKDGFSFLKSKNQRKNS